MSCPSEKLSIFDPAEKYEIVVDDDTSTGMGKYLTMTVEGGKCFRRIGVRPFQKKLEHGWVMDGGCPRRIMLVGKVGNVKTYVLQTPDNIHLIMTEREINP